MAKRIEEGRSAGAIRRWVRPGRVLATGPVMGCAAGLLAGGACHAEWDAEKYLIYDFGRVSLRPQFETGIAYDSNIFYSEEDPVDDIYFIVRPGLSFVYGDRTLNFVSLRYTMDGSFYLDRDDLNNLGHLFGHETRVKLARWNIQANDNLAITRTLLGGSFSYIQERVGLISLNDLWRADYELSPKTLLGAKVGFDYADYDGEDLAPNHLYDYMGYTVGTRFGYLPSDKLVVFPELTFGQSFLEANDLGPGYPQRPEAPDVSLYAFSLGVEGDFTPKLTGIVSGGYEIREYSDDTDIPNGWVGDLRLRWEARPKTTLTVGYRQFLQLSREAQAIPYTVYRPNVSINQQLGTQGRWSLTLDSFYEIHDYPEGFGSSTVTVDRTDDYAYVGLRASWRWQPWLTVAGSYEYRNYSDNIDSIPNYDVHRVSLRLIAGY